MGAFILIGVFFQSHVNNLFLERVVGEVPVVERYMVPDGPSCVTDGFPCDFQMWSVNVVFLLGGPSCPVIVYFIDFLKQWSKDFECTVGFEPVHKLCNFEVSNIRWFHYMECFMYRIHVFRELCSGKEADRFSLKGVNSLEVCR